MSDPLDAILAARRERRVLGPPGAEAPRDVAAGYALQHRLARAMGAVPPAGFKIGATTRQMQAYLGLDGPAASFCAGAGLHAALGVFRRADYVAPGVECEIGLRLCRDVAAGPHDPDSLAACVGEVFAAIEVVDRRYDDLARLGTPMLIADQVFHAGGVLGRPAPGWGSAAASDLAASRGRIMVDGVTRGEGVGADLLGHPLRALAWLAESGAARVFGGLRAGQVVFLGSVTPPIWLDGPCEVRVAFDSLGEALACFT